MSRRVFLDSNVLLYTLAAGDHRQAIACETLARGGIINVQVLDEVANVARRKLGLSWPEIADALAAMRTLCGVPLPLTLAEHERALGLAETSGLAFYDALIVAAALEAGCTTLLSEDMHDGLVVAGRLTIENPFRTITASR